jgi:putative transposase
VRNVRLRTRKSANSGTACGVDVGVAIPVAVVANDNAVTRFGSDFVAKLNEAQRRRAKAQRVLARKKTGSANHAKQKLRVQRAFLREVFLRNNFHEKTSSKIASRFSVVCAEDLKVKSLYRNNRKMKRRRSNRDLASMGHATFLRRLEQKTIEARGTYITVDPAHTSTTCSCCGNVNKENRKSQADFLCCACGFAENADTNAATNIMLKALAAE